MITLIGGPDHRADVRDWICSRIRDMQYKPDDKYEAIGALKDGRLIGGVIYTDYRELSPGQHDIGMHAAGEPGWLTPSSLRGFFNYPFNQLRCVRVTIFTTKSNRRLRDLVRRLGYREEGCLRDGFGLGRDGILYGMTRQECRWIKEKAVGQKVRA